MIRSVISAIKQLPPVPIASQSTQKMRDWAQTTMTRAGTSLSYLYQREIQRSEPVSLERSDFEEQQENSEKQNKDKDGMLKEDSLSDDGDIQSLEREAEFHFKKGSRFERGVFASTAELCSINFISLVTELCDCRHLLRFMHLLTLSFVSLIITCLY